MSVRNWTYCILGLMVSGTFLPVVRAADNPPAIPKPVAEKLPDVVIRGKDAEAVPKNEDYTTLPPRDLIERPVIESPGLES